jgi:predicted CoA-binding protein
MRLSTPDELRALLERTRTIAVLGMKPESRAGEPAFYVPAYAAKAGYDVIPVPTYYPELKQILGRDVVRSLASIGRPIDLVDVFRKPSDLMAHLPDLLEARPRAVWLQSGIRHADFTDELVRAGIDVVEDRCLMVELRAIGR